MKMARKSLALFFLVCAIKTSFIVCMEEDSEGIEAISALIAEWKDKKEIVQEYMKKAEGSKGAVSYIVDGKVLATFSCPDTVVLDPGRRNQSLACTLFLLLIAEMNGDNYPSSDDETQALIQRKEVSRPSLKRCNLY